MGGTNVISSDLGTNKIFTIAVCTNMILFPLAYCKSGGGRGDIRRALLEARREGKKLILQTA